MGRQMTRADLPSKKNRGTNSLKVPVFYKGELRLVCDIHFGNDELCYLEDGEGLAVKIADCTLLTKEEGRLLLKLERKDDLSRAFGSHERFMQTASR